MKDPRRDAEDEALVARRMLTVTGMDPHAPLCTYCNADFHTRPDCPTKALQDQLAAQAKAAQQAYEEAMAPRRKPSGRAASMHVRRKVR